MSALMTAEQCAALRSKARILYVTATPEEHPTEGIPGSIVVAAEPGESFAELGISDDTPVVLYDAAGNRLAARIWYLAKVAGLGAVAVLDGGLPAWQATGRNLAPLGERPELSPGTITAEPAPERLAGADETAEAARTGSALVVDVRPAARFAAENLPGSVNLPLDRLVDAEGSFVEFDALLDILEEVIGESGAVIFIGDEQADPQAEPCVGALAASVAGYGDVQVCLGYPWNR